MRLTDTFNRPAGFYSNSVDNPAALAAENQATAQPPQRQATMLGSLNPTLPTQVAYTKPDIVNVHGQNPRASAQANIDSVAGVVPDVNAARAGISNTIRSAQNHVREITKNLGHDPNALFPKTEGPGTGVELLAAAVVDPMAGAVFSKTMAGTVGKAVAKYGPDVDFVLGDLKRGRNLKEIMGEIQEKLVQSSSPPPTTENAPQIVTLMPGAKLPPPTPPSQMNWQKFFDQGHKLEELMALDPDSPNLPESLELNRIENNVEEDVALAKQVLEDEGVQRREVGREIPPVGLSLARYEEDPEESLEKDQLAVPENNQPGQTEILVRFDEVSQTLPYISGVKITPHETVELDESSEEVKKATAAIFDNEPLRRDLSHEETGIGMGRVA